VTGKAIYREENSEAIIQNIHILEKEKSKVKSNFSSLNYGIPSGSYDADFWKRYEMVSQVPYSNGVINDLQRRVH
jgi:hypothetical protein